MSPLQYYQPWIQFCFNSHLKLVTSNIGISTLDIQQERTSWFYLRIEWTSTFKGFQRHVNNLSIVFCLDIVSCRLNETIAIFGQEKYIMVISFRHLFFISLDLYCSYISTIWLLSFIHLYWYKWCLIITIIIDCIQCAHNVSWLWKQNLPNN